MVTNAGRRISFYEIASLFRDAYEKTATVAKATSGFRCTGIWPFNPDIFDATEFAPSSVTDRPLVADANSSILPRASHSEGQLWIEMLVGCCRQYSDRI